MGHTMQMKYIYPLHFLCIGHCLKVVSRHYTAQIKRTKKLNLSIVVVHCVCCTVFTMNILLDFSALCAVAK